MASFASTDCRVGDLGVSANMTLMGPQTGNPQNVVRS